MSDDLTFPCQSCGAALTASLEHCGHIVNCPSCATPVQIPSPAVTQELPPVFACPAPPPALWKPNEAALWSVLLTPAFGALLHAKNAETLGREKEASANWFWFALSVGNILWGILMAWGIAPDYLTTQAGVSAVLVFGWYFLTGTKQASYVKKTYGPDFPRKSFDKPLLCWLGCIALLVASGAVFQSLQRTRASEQQREAAQQFLQTIGEAARAAQEAQNASQSIDPTQHSVPEKTAGWSDRNDEEEAEKSSPKQPTASTSESADSPPVKSPVVSENEPKPEKSPESTILPTEEIIRAGLRTIGNSNPILAGYRRGSTLESGGGNGRLRGTTIYPIKLPNDQFTYYFFQNEFGDWFININNTAANVPINLNSAGASSKEESSSTDASFITEPSRTSAEADKAAAKNRLSEINSRIESDKAKYASALAVINRLTNNKKTAVKEGSREYKLCYEASITMKEIEEGVPALKKEKARLEAILSEN